MLSWGVDYLGEAIGNAMGHSEVELAEYRCVKEVVPGLSRLQRVHQVDLVKSVNN